MPLACWIPGAAHSVERGSQIITAIPLRISVVQPEPRRSPDGAKVRHGPQTLFNG